jgi:hypothetical protein
MTLVASSVAVLTKTLVGTAATVRLIGLYSPAQTVGVALVDFAQTADAVRAACFRRRDYWADPDRADCYRFQFRGGCSRHQSLGGYFQLLSLDDCFPHQSLGGCSRRQSLADYFRLQFLDGCSRLPSQGDYFQAHLLQVESLLALPDGYFPARRVDYYLVRPDGYCLAHRDDCFLVLRA